MPYIHSRHILLLAALFSTVSCVRDAVTDCEEYVDGDFVEIKADVTVASQCCGTDESAATRAILDPSDADDTPIHNLWVVQYKGTDDKATVIGKPQYIPEFDRESSTIRLLQTPSPCIIVFIANTFNESLSFYQGSTIADLKDKVKDGITKEADFYGYNPASADASAASADAEFPEHNSYYQILNGAQYVPDGIDASTSIKVDLKHNLAKVVLNITNASGSSAHPVTITGVRLHSLPDRFAYFTNFDYDKTGTGYPIPDIYPLEADINPINSELREWDEMPGSGNTKTFTFYMPVNKRGTSGNTEAGNKYFKSPSKSTYAVISGYYTDGPDAGTRTMVTYRIFLGANLVNDFNIDANHVYTYNIKITDISNNTADARVDEYSEVMDFTGNDIPRANCYILNPSEADGTTRRFRIPVDRINVYWGDEENKDGKQTLSILYENNSSYRLTSQTQWQAYIIWADFVLQTDPANNGYNFRFTKSSGTGPTDYMEVEVPDGVRGNVLIGVKATPYGSDRENDGYSWSWHLWITDYDPSAAMSMTKADNTFTYNVINGRVHRYKGEIWESDGGEYNKNGVFMMDRNLGSLSEYGWGTNQGALYYQFGRKDPFPGIAWYNADGSKHSFSTYTITYTYPYTDKEHSLVTVPKSVQNPVNYIYIYDGIGGYYWTFVNDYDTEEVRNNDLYNPDTEDPIDETALWYDYRTKKDANGKRANYKSLFDPCPPGWNIPLYGTFQDFIPGHKSNGTTNISTIAKTKKGFRTRDDAHGMIYWPNVETSPGSGKYLAPSDEIYFPYRYKWWNYNGGEISSSIGPYIHTSEIRYVYGGGFVDEDNRIFSRYHKRNAHRAMIVGTHSTSDANNTIGVPGRYDNKYYAEKVSDALSVRCISNSEYSDAKNKK